MTEQRTAALKKAQAIRSEKARLCATVRGNPEALAALILDPPDALANIRLFELARMSRRDRCNRSPGIEGLGRRALIARVNLMVPLGRASVRSREWLAADPFVTGHRRSATA